MALTIDGINKTLMGNLVVYLCRVTGDGSSTTFKVPMKRVVGVFTGNIDESSGVPGISASGNTLTYGSAPSNGAKHYVIVIGTP